MSLQLSDEQSLLQQSVARFLERGYSFDARRKLVQSELGFSKDNWAQFAELGWLAVSLPEDVGGLGGGPLENMVVCEGFGRSLVLEPFISTAVLAARAVALADNAELRGEMLERIAGGQLLVSLAFAEAGSRYDLHHVETRASAAGNGYALSGGKIAVLDAPSADKLIVAARLSGGVRDEAGVGLFVVDRNASGLSLEHYPMMDGSRGANLALNDTPAVMLVGAERGLEVLESAVQWAIAARSAQAVGSMDASYGQTLEYVKTREQFGQPIGRFQVIQHRMVDMYMRVTEAQTMVQRVARHLDEEDAAARRIAVSGAKAFIGRRARAVGQEIVQLHGGVGMTEELAIGHYFRALTLYCSLFGSTEYHLNRYAAMTQ
ncbi:MAG: acyl-CoA dehydrogenase family protein [Gammaproteobacteria bacterium]|nr:acyl-CoA dehydrogenase family protein [Gammaproteobacteria bacterium]